MISVDVPPDNGATNSFVPPARIYYPGVSTLAKARPVRVSPRGARIGMAVTVPPTRTVDIAVTRNGTLESASVSIQDIESETEASLPVPTHGSTMNLFAGRAYRLVAYRLKPGSIEHSEPLVIPTVGNETIELRIAHPGFADFCPRCRQRSPHRR